MKGKNEWSYLAIRVSIGLLFFTAGLAKLMNPAGVTGMLTSIGFPVPSIFAWILILSEILFGLSVLIGFKVKYTVWPLVIVFVVAISTVTVPGALNSGSWNNTILHVVTLAGLVHIAAKGPGIWAVSKN